MTLFSPLHRRLAFVFLVLATPVAWPAFAETVAPKGQITVTGQGVVDAAPDMAIVSLGVTTQGATVAEAMDANTAAIAAVLAEMKTMGVEDRDLQTSNLSLSPDFTMPEDGSAAVIRGYTASNQLTVRVRDLSKLGTLLDRAVTGGANTLNGLTFTLADAKPALDEARKSAVKDARDLADLLVTAAGAKLGRIMSISEGGGYAAPAPMFRMEQAAMADAIPVQGGEVSTTASVTITFEIEE